MAIHRKTGLAPWPAPQTVALTPVYVVLQARNSLYFPPDADIEIQAGMPKPALDPATKNLSAGEPKAIRYNATRLHEMARPPKDAPSPSRSRIHAAISGTPCELRFASADQHCQADRPPFAHRPRRVRLGYP